MYQILINRAEQDGTLEFSNGGVVISTTCWWDPSHKIPEQSYYSCSATTMASKRNSEGLPREAIYINGVSGYTGIFIHMGYNSSWSDGCIVIPEAEMVQIYNTITPKDARNVTVTVRG